MVGAGPAGGALAGLLAQRGVDVLLIDRLGDLDRSAFSSAALPRAAVERFAVPATVQAARGRGWRLVGPGEGERPWDSAEPLGAVLDFGALRQWLADRAQAQGARLALGLTGLAWEQQHDGTLLTTVRGSAGGCHGIRSDWVVDAAARVGP